MPVGRWVMRTAESVTLTCWPPAPLERIGVDAEILVVDLDVDVLRQLGPDVDRGERGVAARRLIERRDAHQPMDAGFGREQPVGVVAGHGDRRALQPGLFARLIVDDLALEAAALGPAQVHAQQHLGPVLRLGAAGAGMNGEDGVLAIVLAAEHLLDLAGLHFLIERLERLRELGVDRLAGLRPFDQHGQVVALLLERQHQIAILLEPAPALQDLLRFGLVLPEIGRGGARLEAGQFFVGAGGFKDSSADRQPAC